MPQKWPQRLVIVRHAQSEQNAALDLLDEDLEKLLVTTVRDMDIPLSERGKQQAHKTGKYVAAEHWDICFSSPYKRALATAEIIVSQCSYPLKIYRDNRLREKEFGRLHGLTTAAIQEQYPEEYHDRERDGKYWYRLPRGENYPDVEMRVHSFLDKLARDWSGRKVLVVTHQVPYLSFRTLFEHLTEKEVIALGNVPNCTLQEYALDTSTVPEGRLKLKEWNKVVWKP